jgi:peptide chain release factor 1
VIDIKSIKEEYEKTLNQLSDPELISDWQRFEELSKKKKELEKIIEKEKEIKEIEKEIEENKAILKTETDKDLVSLAEAEIGQFQDKKKILERELAELFKNYSSEEKETKSSTAVIMEIRAGTGGKEAALFAGDLFRMYSKYAASQNWKEKILDSHPTELGGFKEIVFELKPGSGGKQDIFSKMRHEGGVHRVQRIPETEKSGRIHTSTATVAVLLKPKPTEVKIKPQDLKIDFYHSSGPGGQNVNKRMTAVRITHLPTGLVVTSQNERNQLQNKENALAILAARVSEKEKNESQTKIEGERKAQIGWAKRAEKIRTYNFPQDRVTDHRIKKSWHNIEDIMEGKIDKIIEALAEALAKTEGRK